jgi:hypothetical protein
MIKAEEIEKIVNELLELKKTKTRLEIDLLPEYSTFRESQKMFYNVVLSEEMDLGIFNQMMAMKRRVEGGEDQYSVDVRFGKFMAEKYIDPLVSSPRKQD